MTHTHLTTNELVMIEAYYQEGMAVSAICHSSKDQNKPFISLLLILRPDIPPMTYDYYKNYKANKQHCGRRKTQLTQSEQTFIQMHLDRDWSLDVVKGTYPDKISYSMRTLYRLVDRGIFKKEDLPWNGKRKPNGKTEKRGKQAFRRDIRERSKVYPEFDSEFGHLEGDTIVGKNHKRIKYFAITHEYTNLWCF